MAHDKTLYQMHLIQTQIVILSHGFSRLPWHHLVFRKNLPYKGSSSTPSLYSKTSIRNFKLAIERSLIRCGFFMNFISILWLLFRYIHWLVIDHSYSIFFFFRFSPGYCCLAWFSSTMSHILWIGLRFFYSYIPWI